MTVPRKLIWRLSVTAVGAVATIASKFLLGLAWKAVTGRQPPKFGVSTASRAGAVTWAVASGIGIGLATLFARRLAGRWLSNLR